MILKWSPTPKKVRIVIQRIIEISHPKKLILFGSYIRGEMHQNSDLDILVVTCDDIENTRREGIRIRRCLKGMLIPMDIIVVRESLLEELKDAPGLIYREIIRNGEVVYESQR